MTITLTFIWGIIGCAFLCALLGTWELIGNRKSMLARFFYSVGLLCLIVTVGLYSYILRDRIELTLKYKDGISEIKEFGVFSVNSVEGMDITFSDYKGVLNVSDTGDSFGLSYITNTSYKFEKTNINDNALGCNWIPSLDALFFRGSMTFTVIGDSCRLGKNESGTSFYMIDYVSTSAYNTYDSTQHMYTAIIFYSPDKSKFLAVNIYNKDMIFEDTMLNVFLSTVSLK